MLVTSFLDGFLKTFFDSLPSFGTCFKITETHAFAPILSFRFIQYPLILHIAFSGHHNEWKLAIISDPSLVDKFPLPIFQIFERVFVSNITH